MELQAGTVIDGRLTLLHPLGKGGMGQVWVARNAALDVEVAVKFVVSSLTHIPEVMGRFRREARLAAQIKSPHVVQVHDVGAMDDGTAYIVMERLEGESLAARLRREQVLAPAEVDDLISQVAGALAAAHDLEIIHRDIKPDNLFFVRARGGQERASFVKVLDFGIARQIDSDGTAFTQTGAMVGTLAYMSPEQLRDTSTAGRSTDVWAVAVVAYEALTGKTPFGSGSAVSVFQAMQAGALEQPASGAALAPPLDAFFRRAFTLDPAQRFDTVESLAKALHEALGGQAPLELAATTFASSPGAGRLPATTAGAPPSTAAQPTGSDAATVSLQRPAGLGAFIIAVVVLFVAGIAALVYVTAFAPHALTP